MNNVVLVGRLVADPNLRYTQSGVAVASFTIAVDRPFKSEGGEREADFLDIVTWRKQAETVANHLNKGRLVAVQGRLQIRSYEDQNGVRRKAAEIVAEQVRFLDRAGEDKQPSQPQSEQGFDNGYDDIPF